MLASDIYPSQLSARFGRWLITPRVWPWLDDLLHRTARIRRANLGCSRPHKLFGGSTRLLVRPTCWWICAVQCLVMLKAGVGMGCTSTVIRLYRPVIRGSSTRVSYQIESVRITRGLLLPETRTSICFGQLLKLSTPILYSTSEWDTPGFHGDFEVDRQKHWGWGVYKPKKLQRFHNFEARKECRTWASRVVSLTTSTARMGCTFVLVTTNRQSSTSF
jgi:hypothetical protein